MSSVGTEVGERNGGVMAQRRNYFSMALNIPDSSKAISASGNQLLIIGAEPCELYCSGMNERGAVSLARFGIPDPSSLVLGSSGDSAPVVTKLGGVDAPVMFEAIGTGLASVFSQQSCRATFISIDLH